MILRVAAPSLRAFQLRPGEEGVSVFNPDAVDPPLTEAEVLDAFRAGCVCVGRSAAEIHAKGLQLVPVPGADPLPTRLRDAHAEIRPGPGMTRAQFKQSLKELE